MQVLSSPLIVDLKAGGASDTASVTPTTSPVAVDFSMSRVQQEVAGRNYTLCRLIVAKMVVQFDQGASGAVVNWDELFRMIDSHKVSVPILGVTHEKEVFTGPIAKHVCEYISLGWSYWDGARAQLVAADGDVTGVHLYTALCFTNETSEDPEGFWPWVGTLRDMTYTFSVAAATAIAAASTGAASEAPCTLSAWLETYVSPQFIIPTMSTFRRYLQQAAAGTTGITLEKIGMDPGGLKAVEDGSRLMAILELQNVLGLGGASTGDLYTSVAIPELGQEPTVNIDSFVEVTQQQTKREMGGNSLAGAMHPRAGGIQTMAAVPNGSLFNTTLKYAPWRITRRNGRIEQAPTIRGDVNIRRTFTATPTTGTHLVITNEVRQLTRNKQDEIARGAGVANMPRGYYSSRALRPSQMFGQGVVVYTRQQ